MKHVNLWLVFGVVALLPGCIIKVYNPRSCECENRGHRDLGGEAPHESHGGIKHVGLEHGSDEHATASSAIGQAGGDAPDCVPPQVPSLDSIPRKSKLLEGNGKAVVVFEVDGDDLIGVAYGERAVAEASLGLWQEFIMRVPTNQRLDLVQFEITKASDPAGNTDNSGTGSMSGRLGFVLSFSQENLERNQADPCATLARHRGTYDWTMIHEFGHLRHYADGTTNDFIRTFGSETGPGRGYPSDGSPRLDGDWVSSYAERAGGDEDCAEAFTAFIMLDELPVGDSLAAQKVRWFASRPGYPELRRALRVTEFDGSREPLAPAPRAQFPLVVEPATWMIGSWEAVLADGTQVEYVISPNNIVRSVKGQGKAEEVWSYRDLREQHPLTTIELYEMNDSFYLHQVSVAGTSFSESFRKQDSGLEVENERLGDFEVKPPGR